jgi:D-glycero-D-manno-heptose 1,7-bisphosphate phosphatase
MKLVIVSCDHTVHAEREGVLHTPATWQPQPGALDAMARLNHAGYHVVLAANLPGLGLGRFDTAALNALQAAMNKQLAAAGGRVEALFYCPHAPDEGCTCRKPLPGLFQQIGERYKVDLHQVHAVGDSLHDVQAAIAAGCIPHLVLTDKNAPAPTDPLPPDTRIHTDLAAFASALIGDTNLPPLAAV